MKHNARIEQQRVRNAGRSGGARNEFVATVRELVRESDEGRAASGCMIDLKRALAKLDERLPRNQR